MGVAWVAGFVLAGTAPAAAQTLDRVVASIGRDAITASDVDLEYRFERFLDGQWPPPAPDPPTLAAVRDRLTYQILLTREENPGPADKAESEKSAAARLAEVRKGLAHPEDFQRTLQDLGMTEAEVLARLARQELMLRLIDQRLRPEASPTDEAVAAYYRASFLPELQERNPDAAAHPLSQVEGQIREILIQKRINELLEQWIEELKPTIDVRFHSF